MTHYIILRRNIAYDEQKSRALQQSLLGESIFISLSFSLFSLAFSLSQSGNIEINSIQEIHEKLHWNGRCAWRGDFFSSKFNLLPFSFVEIEYSVGLARRRSTSQASPLYWQWQKRHPTGRYCGHFILSLMTRASHSAQKPFDRAASQPGSITEIQRQNAITNWLSHSKS